MALGEVRAELRQLEADISAHLLECRACSLNRSRHGPRCPAVTALRDQAAELRGQIKTWFDPGPDQGKLWPS